MSELASLYQEVLVDHYKRPRNFGPLDGARHRSEGHNPLCGDRFVVYLQLGGGRVRKVSFEGAGCAISTASASLMSEAVMGKTVAEAKALFEELQRMLTGDPSRSTQVSSALGKLEALSGVRAYPLRVKCATLPWHTFLAALGDRGEPVSTE